MSDYNGWTNRETWAVNLHWSNNYGDYQYWTERASDLVADHATDTAIALLASDMESTYDDMLESIERAALNAGERVSREAWLMLQDVGTDDRVINWREIAEHWINDAVEYLEYQQ